MGNTISIRINNSNNNINQKQTSIRSTLNISANRLLTCTQFTIYNLLLEDVATFKMVCKLANFKKVACPKIVNLKY